MGQRTKVQLTGGAALGDKWRGRDILMPSARADERSPWVGWRLVGGLTALAAVALGVSFALLALAPGAGLPASTANAHASVHQPWVACARAVRHRLAGPEGVDVTGPAGTRWEPSGAAVDLTGRATGSGIRPTAFGCHAIRLGTSWQVERLVFTER